MVAGRSQTGNCSPSTPRWGRRLRSPSLKAPTIEDPQDTNKDNVYEVTIVVTDSADNMDEYPVTVKVINSTEDNEPGEVTILNRVPEAKIRLSADSRRRRRRHHRSEVAVVPTGKPGLTTGLRTQCDNYMPEADNDDHRFFIDDPDGGPDGGTAWELISGATSAHYTPVTVYEADGTAIDTAASDNGRCLRVAVTYRDAIDRTHSDADDSDTDRG